MDLIVPYLPRTEDEFVLALEIVHIIGAIGTLVTAIQPIPYGRYSSQLKLTGWSITAQTLWRVSSRVYFHYVFQKIKMCGWRILPYVLFVEQAFTITWILPVLIMPFSKSTLMGNYPNVLGITLFIAHYVYRQKGEFIALIAGWEPPRIARSQP